MCLGTLGFENAYALAMRRDKAEKYGIRTVADLSAHASRWSIAGDLQFFGRHEWAEVKRKYNLAFAKIRPMDSTLMYEAVARGTVDVVSAYTSDGRLVAFDLVLLADPKHVFPPYDAVLLVSPQAARRPDLVEALRPLVGAITVERDAHRQPAGRRRQAVRPPRRRRAAETRRTPRVAGSSSAEPVRQPGGASPSTAGAAISLGIQALVRLMVS